MNGNGTILVVDDSEDFVELLAALLAREGYQVRSATGGEGALASVATHPPDLVILDVRMPGMDGFEVCRRLRDRPESRDVPVLLMSAYVEQQERVEGFRLGAVDFLTKPIQHEELIARARVHLESRRMRRQLEQQAADVKAANVELERQAADLKAEVSARRCAEASLSASNRRLDAILAEVPEIIVEVDDRKVYTWANPAGRAFFGDDVVGKEAADYFEGSQDTYAAVQPLFDGSDEVLYVESWQRRRDGQPRLLAWWCRSLTDAEGKATGALSTARDITDQRDAENALRQSEARYRATLMSVGDGVIATDAEGRVEMLNPVAEALTGWRQEEARGRPLAEVFRIVNERTRRPVESPVAKVLRAGAVVGLANHTILLARDGGEHPIADSGAPIVNERGETTGVVLVFRDQTEERRAADALRASEERFRTAFAASPDAVAMTRLSDGVLVSANRGCFDTLGFTEEEMLGRSSLELGIWVNPEDRRWVIKTLLAGSDVRNAEFAFRRKDGSVRHGLMSAALVEVEGSPHVLTVSRDVTEHRRAVEALRASEEKFRSLVDQSSDGVYVVQDARFVLFSRVLQEMTGYSEEELLSMDVRATIAPESLPMLEERWERAGRGEEVPARYEFKIRRKEGTTFDVETTLSQIVFEGRPAAQGTLRDVTERRRGEERLRRSEAAFREAQQVAHVGSWAWHIETGQVEWSDEMYRIFGIEKADFTGDLAEVIARSIHPEDRRAVERSNRSVVEDGEPVPLEYRVVWPDGTVRTVWAEAGGLTLDEAGAPSVLTGIVQDITERKRSEAALRESEERLRAANARLEGALRELQETQQQVIQQERLRALGQMASGIAHDFNNALTPVLSYAELILECPDILGDRERALRFIGNVHTSAQSAAEVVARLREFYRHRAKSDVLGPVDLREVAEAAVLLTRPRWKDQAQAQGASVRVEMALATTPPVAGDAAGLREALTNLILNAVDAMPVGGTLTVQTWVDPEIPGMARLAVKDTGVGMPDEVRERALEPFFSTKGERGSGLGLAMVYGIVERHDGTLQIASQPGEGTTVTLSLPVYAAGLAKDPGELVAGPVAPLRILVVDDEPVVRGALDALLTADGHAVVTAGDGAEGLRAFLAGGFDLVITDRAMPGMNGDRLAMAIQQTRPGTPVVMLTGFGEMMQAAGERPSGIVALVSKPVPLDALRRVLAEAMAVRPGGSEEPAR